VRNFRHHQKKVFFSPEQGITPLSRFARFVKQHKLFCSTPENKKIVVCKKKSGVKKRLHQQRTTASQAPS